MENKALKVNFDDFPCKIGSAAIPFGSNAVKKLKADNVICQLRCLYFDNLSTEIKEFFTSGRVTYYVYKKAGEPRIHVLVVPSVNDPVDPNVHPSTSFFGKFNSAFIYVVWTFIISVNIMALLYLKADPQDIGIASDSLTIPSNIIPDDDDDDNDTGKGTLSSIERTSRSDRRSDVIAIQGEDDGGDLETKTDDDASTASISIAVTLLLISFLL